MTQFGAFLDVAIDILSRGVTLALALPGPLSACLIILEAFTFVCTHSVRFRFISSMMHLALKDVTNA